MQSAGVGRALTGGLEGCRGVAGGFEMTGGGKHRQEILGLGCPSVSKPASRAGRTHQVYAAALPHLYAPTLPPAAHVTSVHGRAAKLPHSPPPFMPRRTSQSEALRRYPVGSFEPPDMEAQATAAREDGSRIVWRGGADASSWRARLDGRLFEPRSRRGVPLGDAPSAAMAAAR
eukprot:350708-Chlamydomonas_euryale.AAC.13